MQRHWDEVHASTESDETGWYEEEPTLSLELIERCELAPTDAILDVGAGTSFLVDRLLERGFRNLTVLDISPTVLDEVRDRLRVDHVMVGFIHADLTDAELSDRLPLVQLWQDRAALHFLTSDDDCAQYGRTLRATIAAGGYALLAAYALEGAPT